MRYCFILLSVLILLSPANSFAEGYNYITAKELHKQINSTTQPSILDIQFEGAYKSGHFPAALATYAYPVKTEASRNAIDAKLKMLNKTGPVVIVSHRGGGGAMRAFDHLKSKGIDASRLFILKSGMKAWPYKELIEVTAQP